MSQRSCSEAVPRRRTRARQLVVVFNCFLVVAVACAAPPEPDEDASGPASPPAAGATPPSGGAAAPAPATAEAPVSPAAAARPVLARGEGNEPGPWVEVNGLSRGGDGTVTLRLTLVNEQGTSEIGGYDLVHPEHEVADFASVGGVHLLDSRTMTKVEVDRGPDGRCICSRRMSVEPGGRAHVWARYSALDPATASVSVMVPGFEPIDGVPVTATTTAAALASAATPIRAEGAAPGTWIEVTEISRAAEGTVTVRFTLVNETSDDELGSYDFTHPDFEVPDFATVGGVYLLDGGSRSKWNVDRDSAGKCICAESVSVRPGQRLRVWARFSSVPAEATAVTIIVPGFEPVDNVTIGSGPAG